VQPKDVGLFGEALGDVMLRLRAAEVLIPATGELLGGECVAYKTAAWVRSPASRVSLRRIDGTVYRVIESASGAVLDEVDEARAFAEAYPGAILLLQGATYLVERLETCLEKAAFVRQVVEPYYTAVRDTCTISTLQRTQSASDGVTHRGPAQITMRVLGYSKIWKRTGQARAVYLYPLLMIAQG
jgi:ATP-dependent helicase YprA (DUF1998 family)